MQQSENTFKIKKLLCSLTGCLRSLGAAVPLSRHNIQKDVMRSAAVACQLASPHPDSLLMGPGYVLGEKCC